MTLAGQFSAASEEEQLRFRAADLAVYELAVSTRQSKKPGDE
jgi:hypothetical protein